MFLTDGSHSCPLPATATDFFADENGRQSHVNVATQSRLEKQLHLEAEAPCLLEESRSCLRSCVRDFVDHTHFQTFIAIVLGANALVIGLEVDSPHPRAIAAILYLTLFGSFIGFFCYFYILKHLAASSVALVTMITPVLAISLGVFLNGETVTETLAIGASMICTCLLLFYWGDQLLRQIGFVAKRPQA